jgi:hypothetical protein
MSGARRWGLVWAGAVAVVLGLALLVTPTGVHHGGDCGSVVAPRHPTLHDDDTLEEQVQANNDCPGERTFRAGVAGVAMVGGVAVIVLGGVRRRVVVAVG